MNTLEKKLNALGYQLYDSFMLTKSFIKVHNDKWNLIIETGYDITNVIMSYVDLDGLAIYTQQDLDDLQDAYNQLVKDVNSLN
jgi:hypothetical protein